MVYYMVLLTTYNPWKITSKAYVLALQSTFGPVLLLGHNFKVVILAIALLQILLVLIFHFQSCHTKNTAHYNYCCRHLHIICTMWCASYLLVHKFSAHFRYGYGIPKKLHCNFVFMVIVILIRFLEFHNKHKWCN